MDISFQLERGIKVAIAFKFYVTALLAADIISASKISKDRKDI